MLINGNTGLGVSAPTEKLEVAGNVKATEALISSRINTGDGVFTKNVQVDQNIFINGNTGLGVSAPVEKLEVAGNIKSTGDVSAVNMRADWGIFKGIQTEGDLSITGKLGIGLIPSERLEVDGNIKATQGLLANFAQITDDVAVGKNLSVIGNVGIGQAAGTHKLTVGGDAFINGLLTAET